MNSSFLNTKSGQYISLGAAVLIGGVFLVWYLKRQAKEVADAAAGVVTGNNALTKGTPYEGAGIAGTLGAGVNEALGGAPQTLGEWLGGKAFDVVQWFKGNPVDSMVTYSVLFSDGSSHAVNASAVDGDGFFSYNGRRYRLSLNSASKYYAVQL